MPRVPQRMQAVEHHRRSKWSPRRSSRNRRPSFRLPSAGSDTRYCLADWRILFQPTDCLAMELGLIRAWSAVVLRLASSPNPPLIPAVIIARKWHRDTGGAFCISCRSDRGRAMASRSSRKEFRTSVILTEGQFKRIRKIAHANDASIAWVLRQAIDRYLKAQRATSVDRSEKSPETTQVR